MDEGGGDDPAAGSRATIEALEARCADLEQTLARQVELERLVMGIVSHDLRGPLQAIHLSAEILTQRGGLDAQQERCVRRIQVATDRAARLIRDLLDTASLRGGQPMPLEPVEVDLHALCRAIVDEVQVTHPGRDVAVLASGSGRGRWDAERLGQLIANLVGNALQHSPADAPVVVATRGEGEQQVAITVSNGGPPIDAAIVPHLFEPFRRGASARRGATSVGLGLYICREIVAAHGGTIEVASGGDETSFRVRLPRVVSAGRDREDRSGPPPPP